MSQIGPKSRATCLESADATRVSSDGLMGTPSGTRATCCDSAMRTTPVVWGCSAHYHERTGSIRERCAICANNVGALLLERRYGICDWTTFLMDAGNGAARKREHRRLIPSSNQPAVEGVSFITSYQRNATPTVPRQKRRSERSACVTFCAGVLSVEKLLSVDALNQRTSPRTPHRLANAKIPPPRSEPHRCSLLDTVLTLPLMSGNVKTSARKPMLPNP